LSGASGANIRVDGKVFAQFWIGDTRYDYAMLVGDLQGLDILLGLDWMKAVGANIDFCTMIATFGPRQQVQLRDKVRPEEADQAQQGYVKVLSDRILVAGHTTKVFCTVMDGWTAKTPAVFDPHVTFGDGIHIPSCLVQPDPDTGQFELGIMNMTTEDWDLDHGVVLGQVQAAQPASRPTEEFNHASHARTPGYKIWQVSAQVWGDMRPNGEEEGVVPEFVNENLVPERDIAPPRGRVAAARSLRVAVSNEGRRETRASGAMNAVAGVPEAPEVDTVYHVYNCQGEEISGEGGVPSEELSFGVAKPRRWDSSLLLKGPEVGLRSSQPIHAVRKVEPHPTGSSVERLPEHFRCMMPPPGVLNQEQLAEAVDLVLRYQDLFVDPDGKVGFTHKVKHKIDTQEAEPIKMHPRRKSFPEKQAIEQEIRKMLENGQIMPSKSPWGAPVVLVKKKDGSLRFCIDFRRLNEVTKKDAYPLPRIEECLDALNGSKFFLTMDLASGYWQVAMDPLDQEKTAFTTHMGLYEWIVMPFGLCNAPATFMRLMEMILADIVWSRCLVYLDDIVAFGSSFRVAFANLEAVFVRLRSAHLKLKPKKCELFRQQVEYLGHEVTPDGVRPAPGKVDALHDWLPPKSLAEVRTYLGFTGYYRRFVPDYSEKALPLTKLTKKNVPFAWGEAEQQAFEALRQDLMKVPLLYYVDTSLPFYLDTDASNYAIGAVLSQRRGQEEFPLAFASKTLNTSRQRYCTTKRELYAIMFFMRYFQGYVKGSMVYIRSDHSALRWLMRFDGQDTMYDRWIHELQGYHPWEVEFRPGKAHSNADALSRVYRDCKIAECEACQRMFRKNARCRDEFSEDSGEDRRKPDDDDDNDRPDHKDYASWDLLLHRTESHDGVFGVTRRRPSQHDERHRTKVNPAKGKRREAHEEVHGRGANYRVTRAQARRERARRKAARDAGKVPGKSPRADAESPRVNHGLRPRAPEGRGVAARGEAGIGGDGPDPAGPVRRKKRGHGWGRRKRRGTAPELPPVIDGGESGYDSSAPEGHRDPLGHPGDGGGDTSGDGSGDGVPPGAGLRRDGGSETMDPKRRDPVLTRGSRPALGPTLPPGQGEKGLLGGTEGFPVVLS
jgi:hypothetical protein